MSILDKAARIARRNRRKKRRDDKKFDKIHGLDKEGRRQHEEVRKKAEAGGFTDVPYGENIQ